jgi:Ca2+-binding EF-hand superfamily protein
MCLLVSPEFTRMFKVFDKQNLNRIGAADLAIALRDLGQNPTDKELNTFVREADSDGKTLATKKYTGILHRDTTPITKST